MSRKQKLSDFTSNGRCLAYLRASSAGQARSGLGLMAQREACESKALDLSLKFRRDVGWHNTHPVPDGFYIDAGETAFSCKFPVRNAGQKIMQDMQSGDTVIVSRMDRMFRNVVDFIETSTKITEAGVRLVICSPPIDLGTATGRMLARHLANLAEWESDRKGERIRDALAQKKERDMLAASIGEQNESKNSPVKIESLPSDWRPAVVERETHIGGTEPGRIFLYVRCSHRDSAESGLGMLVQVDQGRKLADQLIKQNPQLHLAEVFTDEAVSATKTNLTLRAAGRVLSDILQEGDHVIFSTLDRGFRSIADMATTLPQWQKRGVEVHFALDGLSMSDPAGRMMANVIVMFAQFEAELTAARTKEARAQLSARGRFVGGREPPFWRVYQYKGTKKLVLDRKQIVAFRLINSLRAVGMTKKQALERCEWLIAKREGRPALPLSGVHFRSTLSSQLPVDYERDDNGKAFPLFTVDRYDWANLNGAGHYINALNQWRLSSAARRKMEREQDEYATLPEVDLTRVRRTGRGWIRGENPNNDER